MNLIVEVVETHPKSGQILKRFFRTFDIGEQVELTHLLCATNARPNLSFSVIGSDVHGPFRSKYPAFDDAKGGVN